jgi:hypothetical protein
MRVAGRGVGDGVEVGEGRGVRVAVGVGVVVAVGAAVGVEVAKNGSIEEQLCRNRAKLSSRGKKHFFTQVLYWRMGFKSTLWNTAQKFLSKIL